VHFFINRFLWLSFEIRREGFYREFHLIANSLIEYRMKKPFVRQAIWQAEKDNSFQRMAYYTEISQREKYLKSGEKLPTTSAESDKRPRYNFAMERRPPGAKK
jgi:hypothetical protein